MDPVFDAQYLTMKDAFSREGTVIEVAYTPAGEVDYLYLAGRLLAVDRDDNVARLQAALPGLRRADQREQHGTGDLVVLSTGGVGRGHLTVPEALDLLDERLGADNPALAGGEPLATPVHVVHTAKLCTPREPGVPSGPAPGPWPAPRAAVAGHDRVRLGVSDTGLWTLPPDPALHPWLAGVEGEPDHHGPTLPGGQVSIPHHAGHGTFVAGVARCMAPGVTMYVGNHFPKSGGELEHVVVSKLESLIQSQHPHLINFSAGAYTRRDWAPLSFSDFHRRHPDILMVAAAGNDATTRPHFPAALGWAVSVGALGADLERRAWFSNHGASVDVYALGEGLVNAFASGVYTYLEPPKRPAQQTFKGMVVWDGTSLAAPIVSGLIAAEMARTGAQAAAAAQAVLAQAAAQKISGVGPFLHP